jgi:probable phosphoglycerate mutase
MPLDAWVRFDVVYLARHGQTEWNREGRKQGQLDSPLTVAGQRPAADLAHVVKTLDIALTGG